MKDPVFFVVVCFASSSLGKPKELNFELWLKLSENILKILQGLRVAQAAVTKRWP